MTSASASSPFNERFRQSRPLKTNRRKRSKRTSHSVVAGADEDTVADCTAEDYNTDNATAHRHKSITAVTLLSTAAPRRTFRCTFHMSNDHTTEECRAIKRTHITLDRDDYSTYEQRAGSVRMADGTPAKLEGTGTIELSWIDTTGVEHEFKTRALHVPTFKTRLFSVNQALMETCSASNMKVTPSS